MLLAIAERGGTASDAAILTEIARWHQICKLDASMHLPDRLVEQLASYLATQPVRRAYMFGSYARGDALAESDLDLVLVPEPEAGDATTLRKYRRELTVLLGIPVDACFEHTLLRYARDNVMREWRLVYTVA